jgi:basic membrane protein A
MKKLWSLLAVCLLGLVGCTSEAEKAWKAAEFRIGMITDSGSIDDKSFNQGTWEGIKDFADARENVAAKYLKPQGVSDAYYVDAIDKIIKNGANVVVTPGFLFEPAIYTAQTKHPDVKFILIDGEPHTADYSTYETKSNTLNILFKEEQSGFLAGYAAVKEGYTNLGFIGGMAVPAVERFGEGYVAGAYYAAKEESATLTFPATRYWYAGQFTRDPSQVTRAKSWYTDGTEVIFAAAGSVNLDVFDAVRESAANKRAIGVDVDQGNETPKIITSAEKKLANAVQKALGTIIDDTWEGGVTWTLGAVEEAVGLPGGDHFRFSNFTVEEYNAILAKLVDGSVVVPDSTISGADLTAFVDALGLSLASGLADAVIPPPAA